MVIFRDEAAEEADCAEGQTSVIRRRVLDLPGRHELADDCSRER